MPKYADIERLDNYYDITDRYLAVFKEIFIKNDHEAHYNMMMDTEVSYD